MGGKHWEVMGKVSINIRTANRPIVEGLKNGDYQGYGSFNAFVNKCLENLRKGNIKL